MAMKKVANPPKFNKAKPYGEIYGSGEDSATSGARYCQAGHYYGGDGRYIATDSDAANVAHVEEEVLATDPGARFVDESEMEKLLDHTEAPKLLGLPVPTLAAMVRRAGGPAFSGDNAPKQYVAWLLKFTQHDG